MFGSMSRNPWSSHTSKLVVGVAKRGLEIAFSAAHDGVQTIGADDEVNLSYLRERFDKLAEH
jgi:hypothetical protein